MVNKEKLLESLEGNKILKNVSLKKLIKLEKVYPELVPVQKQLVPLHFTSKMHYSLYSPTMCAYFAHKSGCYAIAINDYATLSSYKELKKASEQMNIPYSCGYHVECKPLFNEKKGTTYGYGVAFNDNKKLSNELNYVRLAKIEEIKKIIKNINKAISKYAISLNVKEILKKKNAVVTEKNIAKRLAEILVKKFGKDTELLLFLKDVLKIDSCENDLRFIKEQENSYFEEDLAKVIYTKYNLLKSREKREDAKKFIELNKKYGVISSYKVDINAYDEKQLKVIADTLIENNFNAVTFKCYDLPKEQLDKICDYFLDRGLLPISLYRMGLPRQHMPTYEASKQIFYNSLAVIGNSISVNCDKNDGLFGENTIKLCQDLRKRVEIFSNIVIGRR